MNSEDELAIFAELRENTLRVYLCLVKTAEPMSARRVQKKLNFSSPTLAVYHLEKLLNMGLVSKSSRGYALTGTIKVGALFQIVRFGSLLLPRYVFYLSFFIVLFLCYILFIIITDSIELSIHSSFAILLALIAIIVTSYECFRVWRQRPF